VFAPPQDRSVPNYRTDQLEDNAWWLLKILKLVKHKILGTNTFFSGDDNGFVRRYSRLSKTQAEFFGG
jgi:hypothetical protein